MNMHDLFQNFDLKHKKINMKSLSFSLGFCEQMIIILHCYQKAWQYRKLYMFMMWKLMRTETERKTTCLFKQPRASQLLGFQEHQLRLEVSDIGVPVDSEGACVRFRRRPSLGLWFSSRRLCSGSVFTTTSPNILGDAQKTDLQAAIGPLLKLGQGDVRQILWSAHHCSMARHVTQHARNGSSRHSSAFLLHLTVSRSQSHDEPDSQSGCCSWQAASAVRRFRALIRHETYPTRSHGASIVQHRFEARLAFSG